MKIKVTARDIKLGQKKHQVFRSNNCPVARALKRVNLLASSGNDDTPAGVYYLFSILGCAVPDKVRSFIDKADSLLDTKNPTRGLKPFEFEIRTL